MTRRRRPPRGGEKQREPEPHRPQVLPREAATCVGGIAASSKGANGSIRRSSHANITSWGLGRLRLGRQAAKPSHLDDTVRVTR